MPTPEEPPEDQQSADGAEGLGQFVTVHVVEIRKIHSVPENCNAIGERGRIVGEQIPKDVGCDS